MGIKIEITALIFSIGLGLISILYAWWRTRIKGLKLSIYKIKEPYTILQRSTTKGDSTEITTFYYFKNNGETSNTKITVDIKVRTANNIFEDTVIHESIIDAGEDNNPSVLFKFNGKEAMDWIDGTIKFTWLYYIKDSEKTKHKIFPIKRPKP